MTKENIRRYKEIVGTLLYAAYWTRPDIMCVVSLLSRAMDSPRLVHWAAITHMFKYLRGTLSLGLTYDGPVKLSGWTDANWGGDVEKTSTSGYIFTLNGGAVAWTSKRQKAVALSSCESEYYAASLAVSEAIWLRLLCSELGMAINNATTVIYVKTIKELLLYQKDQARGMFPNILTSGIILFDNMLKMVKWY